MEEGIRGWRRHFWSWGTAPYKGFERSRARTMKDIRFILQMADETRAAVPAGHMVFQLYRAAMGRGLSDKDFAAVKKVFESMSDLNSAP
jgi:3-hydroxyisobutyrate dehydrogenase-like beta-hydroxyacid dehydrogenase